MIKRNQRTDHADDSIGKLVNIAGSIWKVFYFADNVVAQEAHEAALQRRQLFHYWCLIYRQQRLHCAEHAMVEVDVLGHSARDDHVSIAHLQRC